MDPDSPPKTKLWPADDNGSDGKSVANDDFDHRVAAMLDDALRLISDTEDRSPSSLPDAEEVSSQHTALLTAVSHTQQSVNRSHGQQLEGEASTRSDDSGCNRRPASSRAFTGEITEPPDADTLLTCQGCYQSVEVPSWVVGGESLHFLRVERRPSQAAHLHFDLGTTNIRFVPVQAFDPDDPAACRLCASDKDICLQPEGLIILTDQERKKQRADGDYGEGAGEGNGEVDDNTRKMTNTCFACLVKSRACSK